MTTTEPAETAHWRPSLHFTPSTTWMNDPNGLITHKGVHHMYFQNNPHDRVWGNMSWGHATSDDLLHWVEQPVALTGTPTEGIFSGSIVWDRNNTSGLGGDGDGPLVALYTSAFTGDETWADEQAQSLAWSTDGGMTWQKHPTNPILARGSKDFRDPKVFWHEQSGRWVMVCVEALDRQAVVHTSSNLVDWQLASVFGPAGAPEGIWECPDLVRVPVEGSDEQRWVFIVSLGSHGPAGGSGMQWMLCEFDGTTLELADDNGEQVRWFDHGPDQYAAVSFSGTGETCRVLGWMSNWEYAQNSPTRPWASAMTLPRELTLAKTGNDWQLRQTPVLPVGEARPLDAGRHHSTAAAHVLRGTLSEGDELRLTRGEGDEATVLVLTRTTTGLVVDRSQASTTDVHAQRPVFELPLPDGGVEICLVEDHGLVEIFCDGGLVTGCVQTFPAPGELVLETTVPLELTSC